MSATLPITTHADRIRFAVHVQPNASRSEIVGLHGDALKVRLAAPPVDGVANEALIVLFAELFQRPRHAITIVRGATTRRKIIDIEGISAEAVLVLVPA